MDLFFVFSVTILIAAVLGVGFKRVGISPIAAYMVAGLIVGPVLGLLDSSDSVLNFLSEIGIGLICFEIGLTLKLGFLRRYGLQTPLIALGQFLLISLIVLIIGISIGLAAPLILVLILITAGTSSSVTYKLIERKGKLGEAWVAVLLGVLVIEDIIQMIGISIIPSMSELGSLNIAEGMYLISSVIFIILILFVLGITLLPRIIRFIAKHGEPEILMLTLLGVAIGFAWVGSFVGVSFAMGAFLAGLICSTIEIPEPVSKRMSHLGELFIIIFFISIGVSVPRLEGYEYVLVALVVMVGVIVVKSISFTGASAIFGNMRLKEAMRHGIFMLGISEFALILASESYKYGLVDESVYLGAALAVVVSTFFASKLAENDEKSAARLYSFIPSLIEDQLWRFSCWLRAQILRRVQSDAIFADMVYTVLKKTILIIAIFAVGSIILLGGLALNQTELVVLLELLVLAIVGILSLVVITSIRRDLESFAERYKSSSPPAEREKTAREIKNGFSLFIVTVAAIFIILSGAIFIRQFFSTYFEIIAANLITFFFILAILAVLLIPFYSRIRRALHEVECTIDSL